MDSRMRTEERRVGGDGHREAAKLAQERDVVVRSRARLFGHPVHPMLIPFPIAFLVAALASDIAVAVDGSAFFADMSRWLTGAGLVTGAAAALFGLVDFVGIRKARNRDGWLHFLGNATVLVLAAVNLAIRIDGPVDAVLPWGLTLSAVIAALLGLTGWLGGALSYRHGIGVAPHAADH